MGERAFCELLMNRVKSERNVENGLTFQSSHSGNKREKLSKILTQFTLVILRKTEG